MSLRDNLDNGIMVSRWSRDPVLRMNTTRSFGSSSCFCAAREVTKIRRAQKSGARQPCINVDTAFATVEAPVPVSKLACGTRRAARLRYLNSGRPPPYSGIHNGYLLGEHPSGVHSHVREKSQSLLRSVDEPGTSGLTMFPRGGGREAQPAPFPCHRS